MSIVKYFPLGIAKGKAFCNRVDERKRLIDNIRSARHSLIISPRRYGKSSLVLYALNEAKIIYSNVDLFVAVNERQIQDEIIEGVKNLISRISTKHEQILQILKDGIKKLRLKLIVGTDGVGLQLITKENENAAHNIKSTLMLLDHLLTVKKQEAVLFIDEIQEISKLNEHKGIEGAIRHVAQDTQSLNIIFSGSNRHLLTQMFDDRNRPLYKLCERIIINRIEANEYEKFLQNISIETWNKTLSADILEKIFHLTELHPYYINVLCGRIWNCFNTKLPTNPAIVEKIWVEYCIEQKSEVAKELSGLSDLQKNLIFTIARGNTENLTGKENQFKLDATGAALVKALKILVERDYLYKKQGQYLIVDPLVKTVVRAVVRVVND